MERDEFKKLLSGLSAPQLITYLDELDHELDERGFIIESSIVGTATALLSFTLMGTRPQRVRS